MAEIVEFLRARLAEDEAVANSLPEDEYEPEGIELLGCQGYPCEVYLGIGRGRVLRDIAAKRELLDAFDLSQSREIPCDAWLLLKPCVYAMAAIWAEHRGYDPSWTVTE